MIRNAFHRRRPARGVQLHVDIHDPRRFYMTAAGRTLSLHTTAVEGVNMTAIGAACTLPPDACLIGSYHALPALLLALADHKPPAT